MSRVSVNNAGELAILRRMCDAQLNNLSLYSRYKAYLWR